MPSISARIPPEDEAALEEAAALLSIDKSTVIRHALREGLSELRTRRAVELYQSDVISTNEAARIAGVTIADWLDIAHDRNLTTQLTPADLDADADAARQL